MTVNGFDNGDSPADRRINGAGEAQRVSEILRHVTVALSQHVRRLHQEAVPVPAEVEELSVFLMRLARMSRRAATLAGVGETFPHVRVQDRLLVTKTEAAERLGVSVRTIERLVATGRLPQVQVERLARFRVRDLEAYVDGLTENHAAESDSHSGADNGLGD